MRCRPLNLLAAATLIPAALCAETLTPEKREFFEKKIRPVLAENCYQCHNSIDKKKGDIALDYQAAIQQSRVLVPGFPEQSRLIQAIRHAPDTEPMPSKAPKLANIIIKNFEEWIRMGAPDPRLEKPTREQLDSEVDWASVRERRKSWWSFQHPVKAVPPVAPAPEWNKTPIDRFIYSKFLEQELSPQPIASPEVLVRRVHLVLTGLPPSPEDVNRFVNNPSSQRYENLVSELLSAPQFGERWARYWMDWFRYAETHGSEGDPSIPHAPQYRDYLIRALNADVPYDQLIREHLAGDLLPTPRLNHTLGLNESAIGPGHFRLAPHGFGVTDAYDEQITFTDNQIDVLTKATLGLTVSCARCHNHKFDPISQEDFYRIYGIMISSRPAIVNVDTPQRQKRHQTVLTKMKEAIRSELGTHWIGQVGEAIQRLETFPFDPKPERPKRGESSRQFDLQQEVNRNTDAHPFGAWHRLQRLKPSEWTAEVARLTQANEDTVAHNDRLKKTATFYADLRQQSIYDSWFRQGNGLPPKVSPAGSFAVSGSGDAALTGIYPSGVYTHLLSDKHTAVLGSVFHRAKGNWTGVRAVGSKATARFSVRSYPLTHGGLHPAPLLPSKMEWTQIRKYFYWNDELGYYRLETALDKTAGPRGGGNDRSWFGLSEVYGGEDAMKEPGAPLAAINEQFQSVHDKASLLDAYQRTLTNALTAWIDHEITDQQAEFLDAFIRFDFLPNRLDALPEELAASLNRYREIENSIPIPHRAPGVIEAEPWEQPLLTRGNYRKESTPVKRGFLEAIKNTPYNPSSSGRLQFADDLLSESNPLTARVMVNRLWHHTFGRGIVPSVDNFGRLGSQPSHPELLDYLAVHFRESGWSIKSMLRSFVTSRTFQSTSHAPSEHHTRDPDNEFLTYFSPRRLDAEAILDTVLLVSNRLDPTQPRLASTGHADSRSIYRRVRRNFLDPFLKAFNLPIPTTTVGRRNLTNVPAQSLMLMNGDLALKAAKSWSTSILADPSLETPEERVTQIFLQAYSRPPSPAELETCLQYLNPANSNAEADDTDEIREAYFRIAHAMLNSKELIYVH